MNNKTKKLTLTAILLSLSLIIGILETLLPPIIPALPFVRIGFSNIILMFSIIVVNFSATLLISILKSSLVPLLVGNPMMILYSLPASVLAISITYILLFAMRFSVITISVVSAIVHNVVQLLVGFLIMQTKIVLGYIPIMIVMGVLAGLVTGIIIYVLLKFAPKKLFIDKKTSNGIN